MLKIFSSLMGSSQSVISQQSAVDTVNQWRSRPRYELIYDSGRREIGNYLQAFDKLLESNGRGSNDKLISTAVERLKAEFDAVLRRHSEHHPGPISTTEYSSITDSTANTFRYEDYLIADMNDDATAYLKNIAERLNSRGKIEDCVRVYKSVRKPYLQSQLKRLRFDELRGDHNQRRYVQDELKVKMELWIQVSKICVKILFDKEKKLCGHIFSDAEVSDECFVGTVKDSAVLLFRFAEDMSSRRQPYEMMGSVLGVYDAFLWVLPSAESLFLSSRGKGIRDVCAQGYARIESDALRMLYELQHDVLHEKLDSNEFSEGRGGVHRTTQVAMDQIDVIVRNKILLTRLIKSPPSLNFSDVVFPQEELMDYVSNSSSFLEQHLVLIILVLLKNLDKKAKSCYQQDPCLGHLFMMNNLRCILKRVEESNELLEMIGARLVSRLGEKLDFARTSYQTTTCDKFLKCLRKEGLYINGCCFDSRPSKATIKKRLNEFNSVYENVKAVHSSWKIPDPHLREEVRRYMCEVLVSGYNTFLEYLGRNEETRMIVEGNRSHTAEDLEALVRRNLFVDSEI